MNADDAIAIDGGDLAVLLARLRAQEGFRIGVREEANATRLVAELTARGVVRSARDLKPFLGPVLARSEADAARYAEVFDAVFQVRGPEPPPAPEVRSQKPTGMSALDWARVVLGCLALLVAAWIVTCPQRIQPPPPPPKQVDTTGSRQPVEAVPVRPPASPAAPSTAPTNPDQAAAEAAYKRVAEDVIAASGKYGMAPTIEELSRELAPKYGWKPQGLAIMLSQMLGVQSDVPLNYFADGLLSTYTEAISRLAEPIRPLKFQHFSSLIEAVFVLSETTHDTHLTRTKQFEVLDTILIESEHFRVFLEKDAKGDVAKFNAAKIATYAMIVNESDTLVNKLNSRLRNVLSFGSDFEPYEFLHGYSKITTKEEALSAQNELNRKVQKHQLRENAFATLSLLKEDILREYLLALTTIRFDDVCRMAAVVRQIKPGAMTLSCAPWKTRPPLPLTASPPQWTPIAAAGMVTAMGLYWLSFSWARRRAYLRRRRPENAYQFRELVSGVLDHLPAQRAFALRTAQALQVWGRRETGHIDAARTVDTYLRTMQLAPVAATTRTQAEYVFLIEASSGLDLQAAQIQDLIAQFDLKRLNARVYTFSGSPVWVRPHAGDGQWSHAIHIRELAALCPDHRLVIVSSGDGFIDPFTRKPGPGAAALSQWPVRAWLTPVPLRNWTFELETSQRLNLPIGRATPEGFRALPQLMGLSERRFDPERDLGDGDAPRLPQAFRLDPTDFLFDRPPLEVEWPDLRATLRRYLGAQGYRWLCACAVYPALRWDLTLFLGVALRGSDGRMLYSEPRLSQLTGLPWFRHGAMPDWLRRALIDDMADAAKDIRRILVKLVADSRVKDGGEAVTLRLGVEGTGDVAEALDDEIFVDFLAKADAIDLAVPWVEALRGLLPEKVSAPFDAGVAVIGAAMAAFAFAAFALAPHGGQFGFWGGNGIADGALPAGAWLPLLAVILGAGLVFASVDFMPVRAAIGRIVPGLATAFLTISVALLLGQGAPWLLREWGVVTLSNAETRVFWFVVGALAALPMVRWVLDWFGRPVTDWGHPIVWAGDWVVKAFAIAGVALGVAATAPDMTYRGYYGIEFIVLLAAMGWTLHAVLMVGGRRHAV